MTTQMVQKAVEEAVEVKKVCCWMCETPCRVNATIKDNKIVKIETDPDFPMQPWFPVENCPKAKGVAEYLYHPDRVKRPLKRVGPRGSGKWQKISWEQALDEIAAKLKDIKEKYGAESIVVAGGTYRTHDQFKIRFMNLLGTPNYVHPGQICWCINYALECAVQGWFAYSFPIPGEAKVIFNWGHNSPWSWEKEWPVYLNRDKDVKFVVIDPIYTESARHSDLFLRIRPGTDGALALAMMNIIINENLYDKWFVENWTNAPFLTDKDTKKLIREIDLINGGSKTNFVAWDSVTNKAVVWDSDMRSFKTAGAQPALEGEFDLELSDKKIHKVRTVWTVIKELVQEYPPEKVEEITWIPSENIVKAARMFAEGGRGSSIPWGLATNMNGRNTTYTELVKCWLRAVVGSLDAPGGHYYGFPNKNFVADVELEANDRLPDSQKPKGLGVDRYRLISWLAFDPITAAQKKVMGTKSYISHYTIGAHPRAVWDAVITEKPYPVKAIISVAGNSMMNFADSKHIYQALKSPNLELLVSHDYFITPTGALADYVLPSATAFERDEWLTMGGACDYVYVTEAAPHPPDYEIKSDYELWRGLGVRLGQEKDWPWPTLKEVADYRSQAAGYKSVEEFLSSPARGCDFPDPEFYKYLQPNPETGNPTGFPTVSGRVELCSSILEDLSYEAFPEYVEPAESPVNSPELAKEYPFILTTGARILNFPYKHTEFRQVPNMRKLAPYPIVLMNPMTAAQLGVANGDWVRIETPRGSVRQKVSTNESIDPQMVSAAHAFWYPEKPMEDPCLGGVFESNINVITTDEYEHCDPITGSWPDKALLCRIVPEPKF